MNHRLIVMLLVDTVVLLAAIPAASQSETSSAFGSPPWTSWGAPDLRGIWDFRTMIPLERPVRSRAVSS